MWIIELTGQKPGAVYVEPTIERARAQLHMLIDNTLDFGPAGAAVYLHWADANGDLHLVGRFHVEQPLNMLSTSPQTAPPALQPPPSGEAEDT
jgi:hypothetical protein